MSAQAGKRCAQAKSLALSRIAERPLGEGDVGAGRFGVLLRPFRCQRGVEGRGQLLPVTQRQQRCGWSRGRVEIEGAAVEIENAVDLHQLTAVFDQAVAQPARLQIVVAALEAHPSAGLNGAAGGVVLQPVRQEPSAGEHGPDIAGGHEAIGQQVEPLTVRLDGQVLRRLLGWGGCDQPAFGGACLQGGWLGRAGRSCAAGGNGTPSNNLRGC